MIKAWKHLCTILHHKNLVRAGCFKIGLYKQGLLHDRISGGMQILSGDNESE